MKALPPDNENEKIRRAIELWVEQEEQATDHRNRDLEGVLESILHASQGLGADPQQHARAIGFVHGFWKNGEEPPGLDAYCKRAYAKGRAVGAYVCSRLSD